jgi:hypothetical protein
MYVEISGRQTGKTTRLVDHASDELINNINDRNFKIAVVTHSIQSGERIRTLIGERFLDKVNNMGHFDYQHIHNILETRSRGSIIKLMDKVVVQPTMDQPRGEHINRFYVDEFGSIPPSRLWITDAYYCTSPPFLDDDFTDRLLGFCDGDVVGYTTSAVDFRLNNNLIPKVIKRHKFNDDGEY